MKKINLRGIKESLSVREMKNVMGGDNFKMSINVVPDDCGGGMFSSLQTMACIGKGLGAACSWQYDSQHFIAGGCDNGLPNQLWCNPLLA